MPLHTFATALGLAAVALAFPVIDMDASPGSTAGSMTSKKFQFWGINESGAEFGSSDLPGVYGKDYTWYNLSSYDVHIARGVNLFRVNFLNERMAQNGLTGALDPAYLGNLTQQVNYITSKGAYALLTPHNYGRYKGQVVDPTSYGTYWQNLASNFIDNFQVLFDTDNEYHDISQDVVVQINQAVINGIRASGATEQYITPEGNAWTGAWTWTSAVDPTTGKTNAQTMGALTDPSDKLIYQMHQYLDSDGSGTHPTCVSSTIMQERLVDATNWLRSNGKKGLIGEFAGANNQVCVEALKGGIEYLLQNTDVWTGAAWWAAGPWWGNSYMFDAEPKDDTAIFSSVLPQLDQLVVG